MTLQRMSPRVLPAGETLIPVFPNGRNPRWIGWLVIVFASLPTLLAVADDRFGLRLVMAALAATIVIAGIGILVLFGSIEQRIVTIDDGAPNLRFRPTAAATLPTLVIALALLLPAVAQLVVDIAALPKMSGSWILARAPYALGVLGLVIIGVRVWQLRTPAGLELAPEGIRGIRGRAHLDWTWDDLAEAGVIASPAAKLTLLPHAGVASPVVAPPIALGSDPNIVAALVRYYLERPAERSALAEGGVAAVRRAEDALRTA